MVRGRDQLPKGELEALVMDLLWDEDAWLAPGELAERLEDRHPVAYTTAMTTLVRLWKKGMVERRAAGRAYAYHPVLTREEWVAERMHELLDAAGDREAALSHFVGTLDRRQKGDLRRAVSHERRR